MMDELEKSTNKPEVPQFQIIAEGQAALELLETSKINAAFGSYFIFDISPGITVHQGQGESADAVRALICEGVKQRILDFASCVDGEANPYAREFLRALIQVTIQPQGSLQDSNGEVQVSMKNAAMELGRLLPMIHNCIISFHKQPLRIAVKAEEFEVPFCGFGFRIISPRS